MQKKYNSKLIPLARELRNNMTRAENKLWYGFLRQYPVGFLRQKVLGHYIADFYCPTVKLVIELDGRSHFINQAAIDYDLNRTAYLEKFGITVVRYTNAQITADFYAVCNDIEKTVKDLLL